MNDGGSNATTTTKKKLNHYEQLHVSSFAYFFDIRRAYLELALKLHPDKKNTNFPEEEVVDNKEEEEEEEESKNNNTNTNKFIVTSEAYRVLSDPYLRAKYDNSLLAQQEQDCFLGDDEEVSTKELYLKRFRELVVLTPQGLSLS